MRQERSQAVRKVTRADEVKRNHKSQMIRGGHDEVRGHRRVKKMSRSVSGGQVRSGRSLTSHDKYEEGTKCPGKSGNVGKEEG